MWAYESVFYQIYPLGFCGAPFENDGVLTHRIQKVTDWIPHIQKLGANFYRQKNLPGYPGRPTCRNRHPDWPAY